MSKEGANKRVIRSTKGQIRYLWNFMRNHPNFTKDDHRSPAGQARINQKWTRLKEALDALGPQRSVEQWKIAWRDQKRKARAEGGGIIDWSKITTDDIAEVPDESESDAHIMIDYICPEDSVGSDLDQDMENNCNGDATLDSSHSTEHNGTATVEVSQVEQINDSDASVEGPNRDTLPEKPIRRKSKKDSAYILNGFSKLDDLKKRASLHDDEITAFGNYIVSSLRKLNTRHCLLAQDEIQAILSKYKLQQLDSEPSTLYSSSSTSSFRTKILIAKDPFKQETDLDTIETYD